MDLANLYAVMAILAPILLAGGLMWAVLHNRGSRREVEQTERATRENYARQAQDDRARDHA